MDNVTDSCVQQHLVKSEKCFLLISFCSPKLVGIGDQGWFSTTVLLIFEIVYGRCIQQSSAYKGELQRTAPTVGETGSSSLAIRT